MSRTNTRNRKKRSKQRNQRKLNVILGVVAIIIIIIVFVFVRNLFFFITGHDVTDENPYPVKGVDVSSYQLDIDWQGLEDEGFKFAFIKATEGSSLVDDRFETNWEEAHKTGMRVGAYHFLSYDTDGNTQADNYINTVNKKWGMLPPVVDVEFYGKYNKKHPKKEKVYKALDVVLERFEERYGMKPVIYTNLYIYRTYISGKYDDYHIWISTPDITETLPDGRPWQFCQYTFKGKSVNVAGGKKYVDMNVFNGSSWDLRNYDGK